MEPSLRIFEDAVLIFTTETGRVKRISAGMM